MSNRLGIVCVYTAIPGECPVCGGHNDTGPPFCMPECEEAFHDRADQHRAARDQERANNEAFAVEVDRLRAAGHTDDEINHMLRGMP